jgi:hypothetical protein
MPRRPLFCQTCDDLLNQLARAADVVAAGHAVGPETDGTECHATSEMRTDLRERYLALRERVLLHLEIAHDQARMTVRFCDPRICFSAQFRALMVAVQDQLARQGRPGV